MMDKYEALSRYYGHESFRPGQEALVDALTDGRDAFGVMPTGGGKSVCYQIPALLSDGITLVVSPLVSLMADQVATLKQMGVAAAYLNATLTPRQMELACERMARGAYKIVYAAPERLNVPSFAALCQKLPIRIVAVDEAHCVSQWGQDFRPSYLAIADFIALFPKRPAVGAFTATATELVRSDIERLLCLKDPVRVVTGFDRPNLFYEVKTPKDKLDALLHFAAAHEAQSGIVYCSTRKTVEQVHAELVHYGFSAARYHAGLSDGERAKAQEDFRFDRVRLIVATNAFGMGIDKSNVSYVLHYNMPQSPEAYYQEAGRAGRDGENAQCVLYFSTRDVVTARWLIRHRAPNEALTAEQAAALQKQDEVRLQKMVDYCETSACLRGALLDYFGQKHPLRCNACANCKKARETAAFLLRPLPAPAPAPAFGMRDVSREAAAFLAGISKMGSGVRCAFAVKMLQKNAQVGTALYEKSDEFLRALAAQLVQSGFVSENEFGGLSVAPRAAEVLRGDVRVFLEEEETPQSASKAKSANKSASSVSRAANALTAETSHRTEKGDAEISVPIPTFHQKAKPASQQKTKAETSPANANKKAPCKTVAAIDTSPSLPDPIAPKNVTRQAIVMLRCVQQVEDATDCGPTLDELLLILRGKTRRGMAIREISQIKTFGALRNLPVSQLRRIADALMQRYDLACDTRGHLYVPLRAEEVLQKKATVVVEDFSLPAADPSLSHLSTKALRAAAVLPTPLKKTLFIRFARGIRDKQLLSAGLDKNPGFGSCRELSRGGMQELISQLIEREFLRIDARGVVTLTDEGRDAAGIVRPRKKAAGAGDPALFDALKARRYELASAQRIPAYAVFSDATLRDMVKKRPKTPEEFRRVSGVGEVKAARYGKDFLRIIAKFE